MRKSQRPHRRRRAVDDAVIHLIRQSRRRNVNRFLEIGSFERIGLVENAKNPQVPARQQSFDSHFRAGNVAFDEQAVEFLFVRDLNFRRLQQRRDSRHGRLKFFGIVGANHALARRQAQRLDDARKLHARKNFVQLLVEAKGEKSRHRKAGIAQDFALAQFAAAIFDRFRRIVSDSQGPRRESGRRRGPVAQRDQAVHRAHQRLLHDAPRSLLRLIEAQRNRAVRPRIFELVAAVAGKHDIDAQRLRGFRETARLVTKLAGKNQ